MAHFRGTKSAFGAPGDEARWTGAAKDGVGTGVPLLVIEAGASLGLKSYVGAQIAVIGVDTFGASAPGPVVMEHYGFTVENVCSQAHAVLDRLKEKASCA